MAALRLEICFPPTLEVVGPQRAGIFVEDAFSFAADFVGVPGTRRRDDSGVFVDAPVEFADAPAALDVSYRVIDDACEAHLHGKLADGVDDGGEYNGGGEVGGGEDANGVFVYAGHEGALDQERALDGDGVGEGGEAFGGEDVVDLAQFAVGSCGKVAWEEV